MEDLMLKVGDDLTTMRSRAGLSQAALGKAIGIDASVVSRFERNQNAAPLATIAAWAEVCGYVPRLDFIARATAGSPDFVITQRALCNLSPADLARVRDLAERLGGGQ